MSRGFGSDGHEHVWEYPRGVAYRRCFECGSVWAPTPGPGLPKNAGPIEASKLGGIVAYDSITEMAQLGDGSQIALEALAAANPSISASFLANELSRLPSRFYSPSDLVVPKYAAARPHVSGNLVGPDGAETLLLEVVRNAGDPEKVRQEASALLTRITNGISAIIRDLDDAEGSE